MEGLEDEMDLDDLEVVLPEPDSRPKSNLRRLKKRVQPAAEAITATVVSASAQPGAEAVAPSGSSPAASRETGDLPGSPTPQASAKDSYWDEDDELEEEVRGALQPHSRSHSQASGSSDSEESKKGSGSEVESGSDDEGDNAYPELQRGLQDDTAKQDRIGSGAAAESRPLAGILEKLLQRRQAVITRASKPARAAGVAAMLPDATAPAPEPAPQPPDADAAQAVSQGSAGIILVSDDDEEVAMKAVEAQEPQEEPREQAPLPTGLQDVCGPVEDTQMLFADALPVAEQGAGEDGVGLEAARPSLHLTLDTETQGLLDVFPPESYPLPEQPPLEDQHRAVLEQDAPAQAVVAAALPVATNEGEEDDEDEEAAMAKALTAEGPSTSSQQQDASEMDEASDTGSESSSESSEEEEMDEEARQAALKEAIREARAQLKDRPHKKSRRAFVEDEAELSDEEGRADSGDDEDDEDRRQHRALLEQLIGHEKDGKRDEAKRAALHAKWQEEQDDEAVQRLLKGVQYGFRSRRARHGGALDDEGGNNYDARLRRAAMAARRQAENESSGDDDSEDADSDDDGKASSASDSEASGGRECGTQDIDMDAVEALSDEEAKAELRQYKQQQLLDVDHAEAAKELQLLDREGMQVLSMFAKAALPGSSVAETAQPQQKQARRQGGFGSELTNQARTAKQGSFLGLASNVSLQGASRSTWQQGNARSYIFGSNNDSNPAASGLNAQAEAHPQGPTSFVGLQSMDETISQLPAVLGLANKRSRRK
ncbi:hypothetical protein WJX73_004104 [Symbiochloris irregularis]|uniref:DNA replication checkpoint mediator MRC1 domain-containing protein n=1 Tax=Symbiochloris irregularis TaxID=706552 RepID=A0AAW1NQE1_9CHLO